MKRFATTLTGLIVLTLLGITAPASAVVVNFPDGSLEVEVRDELGIPEPTEITDTDMASMGSLSATSNYISNIGGLEYGTNLTYLNLGNNTVNTSAGPLTGQVVGDYKAVVHLFGVYASWRP